MKPTDPRNPLGYRFLMAHVDHQGDDCLIYPALGSKLTNVGQVSIAYLTTP